MTYGIAGISCDARFFSQYHASPFACECLIRTLHLRPEGPDINELMTVIFLYLGSLWICFLSLDFCFFYFGFSFLDLLLLICFYFGFDFWI